MAESMTCRKLHSDNNGFCLALGALHKLNIIRLEVMTELLTVNFFSFTVHEYNLREIPNISLKLFCLIVTQSNGLKA